MQTIQKILENRLALVVVILMCALGALAYHVVRADTEFSHAYLIYAAAADEADTAAYLPTATNNPARLDLNRTLIEVLQNKLTDPERLAKARHGLELVRELKNEIDAITPTIEATETAMMAMGRSVNPIDAPFQRGEPQKIVGLASERLAALKDIQALSYRTNFETQKIFQHLVESKGRLSNAFITDLNNQVPATQEEFDRRQARYAELSRLYDQIQHIYADFVSITARKSGD
jgi:hypothetical protein